MSYSFFNRCAAAVAGLFLAGCVHQEVLTDAVHPERTADEYRYIVRRATATPDLRDFFSPTWDNADTGVIGNFRFDDKMATKFMPETKFRMLYDDKGLYIIFRAHDRYVAAQNEHHGSTWKDSCFEFFLQMPGQTKYWNFESNVAGRMMGTYRMRHTSLEEMLPITDADIAAMQIEATFDELIPEAIAEPTTCTLGFFVPFQMLERQSGVKINPDDLHKQIWRANFYHCGFETYNGNPHWAAWAWVPAIDFHLTEYFGQLRFE